MPKLIIFDGIDNTGKTTLLKKLLEKHSFLKSCRFPSENLANSDAFKNLITNKTLQTKEEWMLALFEEEKDVLSKFKEDDIVLVDRMWFSSLIYQGSGKKENFSFERYINNLYTGLMLELGITPNEILHVLFLDPMKTSDVNEKNETKKAFDSKQLELHNKLADLLSALDKEVQNRFLRNIVLFTNLYLAECFMQDVETDDKLLDSIQNAREGKLSAIIEKVYQNKTFGNEFRLLIRD